MPAKVSEAFQFDRRLQVNRHYNIINDLFSRLDLSAVAD
jgi:hypothetical protein